LSFRVGAGSWDRLLAGELVMLDGSRSIFPCERPDESLVARCEAGDIHPSGPLPGKGGAQPMAQAAEVERSSLSADGEIIECLARKGVQASRRPLRTIPTDFDWDLKHERGDHILSLEFVLPAGTYATSLLREIVRFEEAGALASRESA
jgi:tRNA pseudouridine13 synthase